MSIGNTIKGTLPARRIDYCQHNKKYTDNTTKWAYIKAKKGKKLRGAQDTARDTGKTRGRSIQTLKPVLIFKHLVAYFVTYSFTFGPLPHTHTHTHNLDFSPLYSVWQAPYSTAETNSPFPFWLGLSRDRLIHRRHPPMQITGQIKVPSLYARTNELHTYVRAYVIQVSTPKPTTIHNNT